MASRKRAREAAPSGEVDESADRRVKAAGGGSGAGPGKRDKAYFHAMGLAHAVAKPEVVLQKMVVKCPVGHKLEALLNDAKVAIRKVFPSIKEADTDLNGGIAWKELGSLAFLAAMALEDRLLVYPLVKQGGDPTTEPLYDLIGLYVVVLEKGYLAEEFTSPPEEEYIAWTSVKDKAFAKAIKKQWRFPELMVVALPVNLIPEVEPLPEGASEVRKKAHAPTMDKVKQGIVGAPLVSTKDFRGWEIDRVALACLRLHEGVMGPFYLVETGPVYAPTFFPPVGPVNILDPQRLAAAFASVMLLDATVLDPEQEEEAKEREEEEEEETRDEALTRALKKFMNPMPVLARTPGMKASRVKRSENEIRFEMNLGKDNSPLTRKFVSSVQSFPLDPCDEDVEAMMRNYRVVLQFMAIQSEAYSWSTTTDDSEKSEWRGKRKKHIEALRLEGLEHAKEESGCEESWQSLLVAGPDLPYLSVSAPIMSRYKTPVGEKYTEADLDRVNVPVALGGMYKTFDAARESLVHEPNAEVRKKKEECLEATENWYLHKVRPALEKTVGTKDPMKLSLWTPKAAQRTRAGTHLYTTRSGFMTYLPTGSMFSMNLSFRVWNGGGRCGIKASTWDVRILSVPKNFSEFKRTDGPGDTVLHDERFVDADDDVLPGVRLPFGHEGGMAGAGAGSGVGAGEGLVEDTGFTSASAALGMFKPSEGDPDGGMG